MYHRIARPGPDPWGIAVAPEVFEEQLELIVRRRTPLAMDEFVRLLRAGRIPRDAIAVTFDDGYVDNLTEAKPRLERLGVPATVFITTGLVGKVGFWWDELAAQILETEAPIEGELLIGEQRTPIALAGDDARPARRAWRAWEAPECPRESAYLRLYNALQACTPTQRGKAMARLRKLTNRPVAHSGRPMTGAELRLLASSLLTVGAHAVTHQRLPDLPPEERWTEILQSAETSRRLSGQAVHGFAYPHGAQDPATRQMAEAAGFSWACSTEANTVSASRFDLYNLPRLQVDSFGARALARALKKSCA
jgi:peptidoglycan/xylan/chitin deacetylase (PgdA/CDA1 family)